MSLFFFPFNGLYLPPVVFLFLPYLHRHGLYGKDEEELMARNLVFVGITRAMDSTVILTIEQDDPVIRDLLRADRGASNILQQE